MALAVATVVVSVAAWPVSIQVYGKMLAGITVVVLLFDFWEHLSKQYRPLATRWERRNRAPILLDRFRVGGWEPEVPVLLGDGLDLHEVAGLRYSDVVCREVESSFVLPEVFSGLQAAVVQDLERGGRMKLFDGRIARLEGFKVSRVPGDGERPRWHLDLSPLSYYDFVVTNLIRTPTFHPSAVTQKEVAAALERFQRQRSEQEADFFAVLENRGLGNGLTVHLNIIDAQRQLLVGRRPGNIPVYPGRLVSSASGAVNWEHRRSPDEAPNPFVTALREAWEETGIQVDMNDVTFFAMVMQEDQKHPILLGEVILDHPLPREGSSLPPKDLYENRYFFIFDLDDVDEVARWLRHEKWIPASAVAVCISLIKRHSLRKVEDALRRAARTRGRPALRRPAPWAAPQRRSGSAS